MLNIDEFIEKFATQFADSDISNVKADTKFRELDTWDSLTGMAVLMMIQDNLGIILTVDEFKILTTPRELYDYLKKIKNNDASIG